MNLSHFLQSELTSFIRMSAFSLDRENQINQDENSKEDTVQLNLVQWIYYRIIASDVCFCSGGANAIFRVKTWVGELLQNDFPNIILWNYLKNRLDFTVDQVLDITASANDFKRQNGKS